MTKVDEVILKKKDKLKLQAYQFLKLSFFHAAYDLFERVLMIVPEDRDSHIGILMCETKTCNEKELFAYYQNLFSQEEKEEKIACKVNEEMIGVIASTYELSGYLEKESLIKMCRYNLSYMSDLSARLEQKEKMLELIQTNKQLQWIKVHDPLFIEKILRRYEERILKSQNKDEEEKRRIIRKYYAFLKNVQIEASKLYEEALERKENDLNRLIKKYENSEKIEELEGLIDEFESFEGFLNSNCYVFLCVDKINELKSKKNIKRKYIDIEGRLKKAKNYLDNKEYDKAHELYSDVLIADPNNGAGHLGFLESKYKVNDADALFESYKSLFKKEYQEKKMACEEDRDLINEAIRRYSIPGLLEEEKIEDMFEYNFFYNSSLKYRIQQMESFKKYVEEEPSFVWLRTYGVWDIRKQIDDVYKAYEERIDEAKLQDEKNAKKICEDYQHFLYLTYAKIIDKYRQARQDQNHSFETSDECRGLDKLVKELEDLSEYRNANSYVTAFFEKTDQIKKTMEREKTRNRIVSLLNDCETNLSEGNFDQAKEIFLELIDYDGQWPYAYLGYTMADRGFRNLQELFDYCKKLYEKMDRKVIVLRYNDQHHIKEMCDHYEIPGYLSKEEISSMYHFEERYESDLANKIAQRKRILEDFKNDPYMTNAKRYADNRILTFFKDIMKAYDQRIMQAKKEDEDARLVIMNRFRDYQDECDKKVIALYEERQSKKRKENDYQKNVDRFNKDLTIDELKELIRDFEEDYKDSKTYIDKCFKRIEELNKKKDSDISLLLERGIGLLKEKNYTDAERELEAILEKTPDNEEGHLYRLMAKAHVNNQNELFEYYKNLYVADEFVVKEAVKEDHEHIKRLLDRYYTIPTYFEEEILKEEFAYDRTYKSSYDSKMEQKKKIEKMIREDPSLSWLSQKGSQGIKECIKELLNSYEYRVIKAKEEDEKMVRKIEDEYRRFLDSKENEIQNKYQGLKQRSLNDTN